MNCKGCPHFHIAYKPMMPYDSGLVACDKYDLEFEYTSERRLNSLTCWGEVANAKADD